MIVESLLDGRSWFCECNRWFDKNQDDGKIEREILAIEQPNLRNPSGDLKNVTNDLKDRSLSSRGLRDDFKPPIDFQKEKSFSPRVTRDLKGEHLSKTNNQLFHLFKKFDIYLIVLYY